METVHFADNLPMKIYEQGTFSSTKKPLLIPFLSADPSSHDNVIIFPGGGYDHISLEKEGKQIANALNHEGFNAFVLDYRVAPVHRVEILRDAVRAVQFVRFYNRIQNRDMQKLAVMGFSAGGHLAITEAEHWKEILTGDDDIARESGCPDALILCYPVITFSEPFAHSGSRQNFLGTDDAERNELQEMYSAEKQVSPDLPPVFIWHCQGDASVPVQNSLLLDDALTKAGVDHKLTVYSGGAHGLGLAAELDRINEWFPNSVNWLKGRGLK